MYLSWTRYINPTGDEDVHVSNNPTPINHSLFRHVILCLKITVFKLLVFSFLSFYMGNNMQQGIDKASKLQANDGDTVKHCQQTNSEHIYLKSINKWGETQVQIRQPLFYSQLRRCKNTLYLAVDKLTMLHNMPLSEKVRGGERERTMRLMALVS